jgi:hypothetical protein
MHRDSSSYAGSRVLVALGESVIEEVVMVAIAVEGLTFESFLAGDLGSDLGQSFELRKGVAVPISEPNARHEDVVDGLCRFLMDHCRFSLREASPTAGLPYISRQVSSTKYRSNSDRIFINSVVSVGVRFSRVKNSSGRSAS